MPRYIHRPHLYHLLKDKPTYKQKDAYGKTTYMLYSSTVAKKMIPLVEQSNTEEEALQKVWELHFD